MAGFWFSFVSTFLMILLGIFIFGEPKGNKKCEKRIGLDEHDDTIKQKKLYKEEKDCRTKRDIPLDETVATEKKNQQ